MVCAVLLLLTAVVTLCTGAAGQAAPTPAPAPLRDVYVFMSSPRSSYDDAAEASALAAQLRSAVARAALAVGTPNPSVAVLADAERTTGSVSVDPDAVRPYNKSASIVAVTCGTPNTAHAILELAQFSSWNGIKAAGVLYASRDAPEVDEVAGGVSTAVVAILCLAAFAISCVVSTIVFRRQKMKKVRAVPFYELARLETELVAAVEHQQQQDQFDKGNAFGRVDRQLHDADDDDAPILHHHQHAAAESPHMSAVRRNNIL